MIIPSAAIVTTNKLKAKSWEEIDVEVAGVIEYYGGDETIESATILEVSSTKEFDIAALKKIRLQKEEEEKKSQRKAVYEKLKSEFEG